MTLKEKKEKQRKIFDEIYESVKVRPTDPNFINVYLYNKIEEILKIELEYYDLNNVDDKEKLKLQFDHGGFDADWAGKFVSNNIYSREKYARVYNPQIKLNIDIETYVDIIGDNKKWRLSASKTVLSDLFHEIKHYRQSLMAHSGYSSPLNLRIAREKACIVFNRREYGNNHDRFYIEADAEISALSNMNPIRKLSHKDVITKKRHMHNRDLSILLIPEYGFVERDSFIADDTQLGFAERKLGGLLLFYPVLGKEYNMDCMPKRLYELMKAYESEILDAEKIEDPIKKREITKDIHDMYFELFARRIMKGSYFELAEAIRMCGYYEVKQMLADLRVFNKNEKNRKNELIDERVNFDFKVLNDTVSDDNGDISLDIDAYLYKNAGYIYGSKKRKRAIKTDKYMESLNFDKSNPAIAAFLTTDWFLKHLPANGYYVFKNGKKVSIEEFINKYLINYLNDPEIRASEYKMYFIDYVINKLKPTCEVVGMFLYEEINRQYQLLDNKINDCYNSIFIQDQDFNDQINDRYILEMIDTMALIERVCMGEDNLFTYFQITHYEPDISYFESALYPDEVEAKLNKLLEYATKMNTYEEFNPKGINYSWMLKHKQKKLISMIREKAREWDEVEPLELKRGGKK